MAYMEAIEVLDDIQDDVIIGLTTLLENGATIQDEVEALEPNPVNEEPIPQPQQ